jgi:hypothetical protein
MKRILSLAILVLAAFGTTTSLHAQRGEVRATIPFDFVVGDKVLPAGSYQLVPESTDFVLIGNRDQHVIVVIRSIPESNRFRDENILVFDKYGDRYFLNGVHCTSLALNVEIPKSNMEKHMQRQLAQVSNPSQTLIALNK